MTSPTPSSRSKVFVPHFRSGTTDLGMGELGTVEPPGRLRVHGLGSCVVICIHSARGVGGLAHAVVSRPGMRVSPGRAWAVTDALAMLVDSLRAQGARELVGHLAGGASMFASRLPPFRVGEQNAQTALLEMERLDIPVLTADLGGSLSRRVGYDPASGTFVSRTVPPVAAGGHGGVGAGAAARLLDETFQPLALTLGRGSRLGLRDVRIVSAQQQLIGSFGGPDAILDHAVASHRDALDSSPVPMIVAFHAEETENGSRALWTSAEERDAAFEDVMAQCVTRACAALSALLRRHLIPGVPVAGRKRAGALAGALPRQRHWTALQAKLSLPRLSQGAEACVLLPSERWVGALLPFQERSP